MFCSASGIPAALWHSAPKIARQSLSAKFRFPDQEMKRQEPRPRSASVVRTTFDAVSEGPTRRRGACPNLVRHHNGGYKQSDWGRELGREVSVHRTET